MKCIIINNDLPVKKVIELRINEAEDLVLVASFHDITVAADFIAIQAVDIVFLEAKMVRKDALDFVRAMPQEIFLIYVSDDSVLSYKKKSSRLVNLKFVNRFKEAIAKACIYLSALDGSLEKGGNKADDYFVI